MGVDREAGRCNLAEGDRQNYFLHPPIVSIRLDGNENRLFVYVLESANIVWDKKVAYPLKAPSHIPP